MLPLERACDLYESRDFAAVIESLRDFEPLPEDAAYCHSLLGGSYYHCGDYNNSLSEYIAAIEAWLTLRYGREWTYRGRLPVPTAVAVDNTEEFEDLASYYYSCALQLNALGWRDNSNSIFSESIESAWLSIRYGLYNSKVLTLLGNAEWRLGRKCACIRHLEAAIALDHDYVQAHTLLIYVYSRCLYLGKLRAAMNNLAMALERLDESIFDYVTDPALKRFASRFFPTY